MNPDTGDIKQVTEEQDLKTLKDMGYTEALSYDEEKFLEDIEPEERMEALKTYRLERLKNNQRKLLYFKKNPGLVNKSKEMTKEQRNTRNRKNKEAKRSRKINRKK